MATLDPDRTRPHHPRLAQIDQQTMRPHWDPELKTWVPRPPVKGGGLLWGVLGLGAWLIGQRRLRRQIVQIGCAVIVALVCLSILAALAISQLTGR